MDKAIRRAGAAISIAFLITVITQITYVSALDGVGIAEGWPLRSALWTIELLAAAIVAVAALGLMVRDAGRVFIWSALAVSGLLNMLQGGFGLSMFLPLAEAGESFAPVMGSIVAGAFLFFFLAKALIGVAAIGLGLSLFGVSGMAGKIVGALSIAAGLAAAAVNLFAIPQGMAFVFPAGAAGTVAALAAGIAVWMATRRPA